MEKQKVKTNKNTKRWAIVISVFLILGMLFDIFMVGNLGYAVKWVECGQRPVVVRSSTGFLSTGQQMEVLIIEKPGFFDLKDILVPFVDSAIYCDVNQAKASVSGINQVEYK